MSSVVVVGAGVVGASVTYHLACLGVPVTLIDSAPAPAGGVTRESFGWIGDSGGDWPGGAEDLRSFVLGDHRRVEAQLPGVPIRWTGSLRWPDSVRRRRNGAGAPRRRVGRDEIRAIEPHLRTVPGRAVYSPGDAAVDPVRMTHALVRAAGDRGAQVVLGAGATALRVTHGQARGALSARGFHPAATIVLAAGTGTTALA